MSNTYNKTSVKPETLLAATPASIAALNNPALHSSDFWNLAGTSFGSASFADAWKYATGAGVTVSIVDEGVNYTHLDLTQNYAQALDYDPRDQAGAYDARPDNFFETHGTEVAGIIAGSASNGFGTIGAAPDASIAASYLRFADFSMSDLASIMAHQASFDVSNNSWGFTASFSDNFANGYFSDAALGLQQAAEQGRNGLGTAMVFAAGNGKFLVDGQNVGDDSNFHNFSNSRYVIAVGAHDDVGESTFFSSPGTNVLLSAPGLGLLTTSGDEDQSAGSTYASGTSFSAPMVSSAIALMLQANPRLGYRDVQEILAISADPSRGGMNTTNGGAHFNGGGLVFDRDMGFGALNAAAAVNLARSWTGSHTAANEQHAAQSFTLPTVADGHEQVLTADLQVPDGGISIEHVQLHLAVSDEDLADLSVTLTSPDGTTAVIAQNMSAAAGRLCLDFTFSSVETWGENSNGTWTLTLGHPGTSAGFSVTAAELEVFGSPESENDTYFFTGSFARLVAAEPERAAIEDNNDGVDRLNFAAASGSVSVDLRNAGGSVDGIDFTLKGEFENIYGSTHDDRITANGWANAIQGDFGKDELFGDGGDDTIGGGDGNDVIEGGDGADNIDGGAGLDTASFGHSVEVNFATGVHSGEAFGDTFRGIERFALSNETDVFVGSAAAINDDIRGMGGDDQLDGGAGNDLLNGGAGRDTLTGGKGNDTFVIDTASDVVVEAAGGGNDTVRAHHNFTLSADVENLVLLDKVASGHGNDQDNRLSGNGINNRLYGAGGRDLINGNGGNDYISGDNGRDQLNGGAGNDTLVGGLAHDTLSGGRGDDLFVFRTMADVSRSSYDVITHFARGHDKIDLHGIDAQSDRNGNNEFHFIGHARPHQSGDLGYHYSGANTIIAGDTNGDGKFDLEIVLNGHRTLTASDFLL